jgi:hypothetical protein
MPPMAEKKCGMIRRLLEKIISSRSYLGCKFCQLKTALL